jgi:hypothetical protein
MRYVMSGVSATTPRRFRSVLPARIPRSSEIERMSKRRAPPNSYAHASEQALAHETLWSEVKRPMPR